MARWFWTLFLLGVVVLLAVVAVAMIGDAMGRWGTP